MDADIFPFPDPTDLLADTWHRRLCTVTDWLVLSGDLHQDPELAELQVAGWSACGITHVIDVREEWSDEDVVARHAPEVTYHHLGTHDSGRRQADDWFEAGLEAARAARTDDESRVLVHCHMGVNRGPSMGFRLLLEAGWEPIAALEAIRVARPIAAVLYADDALRHHLGRIGSETTEGARQLAEVESWLDDHPIDVEGIIRRIHRTAIR